MTRTVCSELTRLSLLVMARLIFLADGNSNATPLLSVETLVRGELNLESKLHDV